MFLLPSHHVLYAGGHYMGPRRTYLEWRENMVLEIAGDCNSLGNHTINPISDPAENYDIECILMVNFGDIGVLRQMSLPNG